ncbi:hypothetical protein [Halorubrum sp. FL23]|uniref:hypothetical protein n=1 Tax=Halorubrum sp. FL23 TaxID=3458704 RepID=UPI004033D1C4
MNELQGYAADVREVEKKFQAELENDTDRSFEDLLDAPPDGDVERLVKAALNAKEPEGEFAHSVAREAYKQQAIQYERRNRVRELVVSLITKGGALVSDTHWELIDQLALDEYIEPPADLFLWESRDGQTLTILTLMEIQEPTQVYERLADLLPVIRDNKAEISGKLGEHRGDDTPLDIDEDGIEGAILIARQPNNSNKDLRKEIPKDLATAQKDKPISIWDFDATADEELTILSEVSVESIEGWNWHVPENTLGELLKNGKQFSHLSQASMTHFPDSHHEQVFRKLPTYLHRRNQTQRQDEDGNFIKERTRQKWVFSKAEFVEYFVPENSTMNHADVEHRIDPLLTWWTDIGVISEKTSGYEPYYKSGDDDKDEDSNDDHTGDEIYTFKHLNTASKDPDGFWNEAVEPYRDAVVTRVLKSHIKWNYISDEKCSGMDISPVIKNPLIHVDQEKISEAMTDLSTTIS